MTKELTITLDGWTGNYSVAEITANEDGTVTLRCTPQDREAAVAQKPENSANTEEPYIRSYMNCSGLVRLLMDGRMITAAVTHCTDKAVRVLNLEFGAAWLPKNVLRWSEVAGMLCVVDADYWPDFTTKISDSMAEYPVLFNAEELYDREFLSNTYL